MALLAGLVLILAIYAIFSNRLPITKSALADGQRIVKLYVDGEARIIPTNSETVGEVLDRAGVVLEKGDVVEPARDTFIPPVSFNINIYRSHPVAVQDGDKVITGHSAYQSPRLILEHLGIEVFPEDIVTVNPVTDIVELGILGQKLSIKRAKVLSVKVDGGTKTIRTQKGLIGEALADNNISLSPDDKVSPGITSPVSNNLDIEITRISDVVLDAQETIERPVQTVYSDQLDIGHEQIKQAGSDGERTATYRVHYRNGREVSRQLLSSEVTKVAEAKIVVVGTRIPSDIWYKLRVCESGGYYGMNNGNGYYGAYQFSVTTWRSLGYSGYPHQASPGTQDEAARRLQARDGWGAWPSCAGSLGLL